MPALVVSRDYLAGYPADHWQHHFLMDEGRKTDKVSQVASAKRHALSSGVPRIDTHHGA
jgi:hypothetical protein